jgi:hypothetical protein
VGPVDEDRADRAQLARAGQLDGPPVRAEELLHVPDDEHDAGLPAGLDHRHAVGGGDRHRLLAEDVQSVLGGCRDQLAVRVVRGEDGYGVQRRAGHQLVEGGCCSQPAGLGQLATLGARVHDRDDVHARKTGDHAVVQQLGEPAVAQDREPQRCSVRLG